jgi:hypothetical protein
MNVNDMRISTSSKLILGILLTVCFLVTPAHAQPRSSAFRGTFAVTADLEWGKTLLRPGTYSLEVDSLDQSTDHITVRDERNGKIMVAEIATINYNSNGSVSQLIVVTRGSQHAVSSLQLAGMGEVLHEAHPLATSESGAEAAQSTEAISIETAKK